MVIVPAGIVEETPPSGGQRRPYTEHLSKTAGASEIPPAPTRKHTPDGFVNSLNAVVHLTIHPDLYTHRLQPKGSTNHRGYVQLF